MLKSLIIVCGKDLSASVVSMVAMDGFNGFMYFETFILE